MDILPTSVGKRHKNRVIARRRSPYFICYNFADYEDQINQPEQLIFLKLV
ncbi:MAG: hypothetical protein JWR18_2407 [Segetibacter sp.]|jgi:hypothetical protein|nr:hypothetical protein [Segetibacter sp.]